MSNVDKVLTVFDKYDPSQPRVPAGSPVGGQWAARSGGIGLTVPTSRRSVSRGSVSDKPGTGGSVASETMSETDYHKLAGWDDPTILAAIAKTPPIEIRFSDTKGSHFAALPGGKSYLLMSSKENDILDAAFRHEYGHRLDFAMMSKGKTSHGFASSSLVDVMAKEASNLRRPDKAEYARTLQALTKESISTGDEVGVINKHLKAIGFNHTLAEFGVSKDRPTLSVVEAAEFVAGVRSGSISNALMSFPATPSYESSDRSSARRHTMMLSDFVSAMTDTRYGQGHSKDYYDKWESRTPSNWSHRTGRAEIKIGLKDTFDVKINPSHATEAFANYVALRGSSSARQYLSVLKVLFPETTAAMDKLLTDYVGTTKTKKFLDRFDKMTTFEAVRERSMAAWRSSETRTAEMDDLTRRYVERFGTTPHWVFESEPYVVMVQRALITGVPMTIPDLPPGAMQ